MRSLARIIADRGTPVVSIGAERPVNEAIKLMAERNIGSVLVMDGEKLVGILSERDIVRRLLAPGLARDSTPVSAVMTKEPYCADAGKSVEACIALMNERRFRHLPVLDEGGKLLGMVSMGDLVKELIHEQAFVIEQFERYVSSGAY